MRKTLALCFLMMGCAASGVSDQATIQQFKIAMAPSVEAATTPTIATADRAAWIDCMTSSIAEGVPDTDLSTMTSIAGGHQATDEERQRIAKWIGPEAIHGDIVRPKVGDPSSYAGGQLHYGDGTPVDQAAEWAVSRRIMHNAQEICPTLATKYRKEIFG